MSRGKTAAPAKRTRPYEDVQMIELHKLVMDANRLQNAQRYSLCDERGESFSLSYWSDYRQHETVIIPAGTRRVQHKLQWGIDEMHKQIEELKHSFGRYLRDEG